MVISYQSFVDLPSLLQKRFQAYNAAFLRSGAVPIAETPADESPIIEAIAEDPHPDNPALPAFVRTLKPPVLKRLIDHVGLRDAGDLIALTTPEQMRDILEESLWESLTPGRADRLRPERFLEWLDVMFEAGSAFATQRLIELGDTFVVLNFAPLSR